MRKAILLVGSLWTFYALSAQQFAANGVMAARLANKPVSSGFSIGVAQPAMSADQQKAIKQQLLVMVQQALVNLQDPDLYLQEFYQQAWGKPVYNKITRELRELKKYLVGDAYDAALVFDYVPSPQELERDLFSKAVARMDTPVPADPSQKEYVFTVGDPLKQWLLARFNSTFLAASGIQDVEMDIQYRQGWRELERWYQVSRGYAEELKKMNTDLLACTRDSAKVNAIKKFLADTKPDKNYVVKLLATRKFFKQWIWYNSGFIHMNPLLVTEPTRLMPREEPNSFALVKSGPALFSSASADSLKMFLTTWKAYNKLVMPVSGGDNRDLLPLYLDAAAGYKGDKKTARSIPDDETVKLYVHNVPRNVKLTVTPVDHDLKDQGAVMGQIDDVLSLIDVFKTAVPGVDKGLAYISSTFNPRTFPKPNRNIEAGIGNITGTEITASLNAREDNTASFMKEMVAMLDRENDFVVVNGRKVVMTKDNESDKKAIIKASYLQEDSVGCKACALLPSYVVDSFLVYDQCFQFDYESTTKMKASADSLIKRLSCFLEEINKCDKDIKDLSDKVQAMITALHPYIAVSNRSLPPLNRDEITDPVPLFQTVVLDMELPEPPRRRVYTLNEIKVKEGTTSETTTVVGTQTIKVARRHYVDLSAGVAYTTKSYTVSEQNGSALPERKDADPVKVIAGLHIYPFGLFKLDNRFPGPAKYRSSLFLGTSVKKALDNFYFGYGYDLVPGVRIIGGVQYYKDTRYKIYNNQVVDQASGLSKAGPYISFNIEPGTLVKMLGLL